MAAWTVAAPSQPLERRTAAALPVGAMYAVEPGASRSAMVRTVLVLPVPAAPSRRKYRRSRVLYQATARSRAATWSGARSFTGGPRGGRAGATEPGRGHGGG